MSTIAFYAPMKPPTHPTPSGDREIARGILKALGANDQGWDIKLASTLRTYDGRGNIQAQKELMAEAVCEAAKLIAQGQKEGWAAWFSYHNYYKAPDLLGPIVTKALDIPYILLEATRAKKRLNGPWANFAHSAEDACDHADVIFYFTQHDRQSLAQHRCNDQQITHLPPFLMRENLKVHSRIKPTENTILSVGMMRSGAKVKSYELIAKTLGYLATPDWHLNIVGDGPARGEVENLFEPLSEHITFLGQLRKPELSQFYETSSVFLWPGVNEAFGMVFLEAQAAGLPIVALNLPGVCDVIAPSTNPAPINTPNDMAHEVDRVFISSNHWETRSQAGIEFVKRRHLIGTATKNLVTALAPLIKSHP